MADSSAIRALESKIGSKSALLGFVGLGYVGLPVSLSFARVGYPVRAYDVDRARVDRVTAGGLPFAHSEPGLLELLSTVRSQGRFQASTDEGVLDGCDIFFLAIDTPITASRQLDTRRVVFGLEPIARRLRPASMLVIESTVAPGTISDIVVPLLRERVPHLLGRDYFLLHCPERLRPGRLLRNLTRFDRIVGGDSPESAAVGVRLYRDIVGAKLQPAHYRTAEVIKTAENTARDVQIALANQIALVCDAAGVNFAEVRAAVNELWADEPLVLEAGPGVGGHCLPKDPWLLVAQLADGAPRALVEGARRINSFMPEHTVSLLRQTLEADGARLKGSAVTLLGVSYNADSDDVRNSPALEIRRLLDASGVEVRLHDPYVREYAMDVWDAVAGTDAVILIDAHTPYLALELPRLRSAMRRPLVIDTRRALSAQSYRAAGFIYRALGVGERAPE